MLQFDQEMADVTVDPECNDPKALFGQGVRAFILQDFENAVAALSKVSELLVVEHKDDLHDSLAEVYLYYGKALLGLSREQNEALGDAVPKNSAEDSEDEEEQDEGIDSEESQKNKTEDNSVASSISDDSSKTESKTSEEKPKEDAKDNDKDKTKGDNKMETDDEDAVTSSKPDAPVENGGEPGPSSSKAKEDEDTADDQGEDDASDLQLAWEVLELARKIYQRLGDKKSLADTLIVLGEVSLESEIFESAINDIKQGLEIQKEIFAKDSRTVAETLYKLGMAYSTNSQLDEAIDSFNQSLEYLKNRIKTLEEIKVMSQEHKDEVEEIKSLIPDIQDKIADMKIYKEEVCVCKEIVKQVLKPKFKPVEGAVNKIEVRRQPKNATIEGAIEKLTVEEEQGPNK